MKQKLILAMAMLAMLNTGCRQPRSDDDSAAVTLQIGQYSTAEFRWFDLLVPRAHAAVSDLRLCFKRLRIKPVDEHTADPATYEDNIDFNIGELTVSNAGVALGAVIVPEGVYRRIEIDLENHCASGKSLQLVNDSGTYSSTDRITVKFTGTFTAVDGAIVELGLQRIVDALNAYNGVGSLRDAAEAAGGSLGSL